IATGSTGFTRTILWMATGAVTLSVAVMILAFGLMTGFKHEITQKMFGFWGHIHVSDPRIIRSYEAIPFTLDANMVESIQSIGQLEWSENGKVSRTHGGVSHVSTYIHLPGIISSKDQMEGIILKGVDTDYNWTAM